MVPRENRIVKLVFAAVELAKVRSIQNDVMDLAFVRIDRTTRQTDTTESA
jgi:hypothetical protein